MRWKIALPLTLIAATCPHAFGQGLQAGPLTLDASLAAREMYDSNVMLQSQGPLANRGSAVSVIAPTLALTWNKPLGADAALRLEYSPTVNLFHNRPEEDHTDHSLGLKLAGRQDRWTYDLTTAVLAVDGPDTPFYFGSPNGVPATGAPAVRDRRSQLLFRGCYKAQYTADHWFIRPLANLYDVDYHVQQTPLPGYCNFVNRSDYNAGFDLGGRAQGDLWAVVGYRFGYQEQGTVLSSPVEASNFYHRVLAGAEGQPFSWLKFNVLAGPDFRDFSGHAPAGLEHNVRLYAEGAATATFSPTDELACTAKRWTLPGYTGKTVFADSAYECTYKHFFTQKLIGRAGFKVCGGEWEVTHRDDWIYTPRFSFEYKLDAHWSFETGYLFEVGKSADTALQGRDYERNLTWIGVKFDL